MSTPIDFGDIQVRDTVTRDYRGIASTLTVAMRAVMAVYPNFHGQAIDDVALQNMAGSVWRLLDRPKPVVVLPSGPTLGWATVHPSYWDNPVTVLSRFMLDGDRLISAAPIYSVRDVTAFVPATAIPAAALDELRATHANVFDSHICANMTFTCAFLAAVDAANGPPK